MLFFIEENSLKISVLLSVMDEEWDFGSVNTLKLLKEQEAFSATFYKTSPEKEGDLQRFVFTMNLVGVKDS